MNDERPAGRPAPQYGEYAPEGWQSPLQAEGGEGAPEQSPPPPSHAPHNLGVGTPPPETGGTPHPSGAPTTGAATRFGAPTAPENPQQVNRPPQQPVTRQRTPSMADRVITIILLVLGGFGALQSAFSMLTLGTQMEIIAGSLAGDAITVPDMTVLQAVGAILMLSIYAIVLLWSIQRLRAKKITFWVPLVGGVVALIATFVIVAVAMGMMPDLVNYFDPDSVDKLLQDMLEP